MHHGERYKSDEVDVKELRVRDVAPDRVQKRARDQLNDRVKFDELERLEGGSQGGLTFPEEVDDAADILHLARERSRD